MAQQQLPCHNWFEQHAYEFAGRLLIPKEALLISAAEWEKVREGIREIENGEHTTLEEVKQRDRSDMERVLSPLRKAEDAILIDSTRLSAEEVVEEMVRIARKKEN